MSSILKALKKLENERRQPPVGQTPLSREVFEGISRAEVTDRSRSPLLLILIALLLVGGGLGGWLLRQSPPAEQRIVAPGQKPFLSISGSKDPLPSFFAPIAAVATVQAPVVPLSANITSPPSVSLHEEVAAPVAETSTATGVESSAQSRPKEPVAKVAATTKVPAVAPPKEAVSSVKTFPSKNPAAAAVPKAKSARSAVAQVPPPSPIRATSTPVAVASRTPGWALPGAEKAVPPELRVSEIHYKPVAQERLAVVNDLPVLEGVDIDGARVDRIFKDRIRFVFNGRYLEVKAAAPAP
ncbi:MAG: hypothetical protein RBT64_05000 [Trichloromonas sp.]|jgi:hypothetical protein|nr:hypothetical protein [Trichloromonas sp.]